MLTYHHSRLGLLIPDLSSKRTLCLKINFQMLVWYLTRKLSHLVLDLLTDSLLASLLRREGVSLRL